MLRDGCIRDGHILIWRRPLSHPRDSGSQSIRPPVYHILLALLGQDRHGLGIAAQIERVSEGSVELGPGTLYRSLSEMTEAKLILPVRAPESDADPRRKYYRITPEG